MKNVQALLDAVEEARLSLNECHRLIEAMVVAGDLMTVGEVRKVVGRAKAAEAGCLSVYTVLMMVDGIVMLVDDSPVPVDKDA